MPLIPVLRQDKKLAKSNVPNIVGSIFSVTTEAQKLHKIVTSHKRDNGKWHKCQFNNKFVFVSLNRLLLLFTIETVCLVDVVPLICYVFSESSCNSFYPL
jgi:hypothetical protein